MKVEINKDSGFCFGVINTIQIAEDILKKEGHLYCLGEIVHNEREIRRLEEKGLETITYDKYRELKNCKVLLRAHGEPPETYQTAQRNNIELIEGTCPVVLKLQERVRLSYEELQHNKGQVVIYGKKNHPEIIGLLGRAGNSAIIIEKAEDLDQVNFSRPVHLYSQTTKSREQYEEIVNIVRTKASALKTEPFIRCAKSTCGQVADRAKKLREFSREHDVILFVSGKKSSNGKYLFSECHAINPRSYFISDINEIDPAWIENAGSVGICGATSTPQWLMEQVAGYIESEP